MSRLSYVSIIAVLFSALGSVLMFIIGAVKTITSFRIFFWRVSVFPDAPPDLDHSEQAMIAVIEAMDAFLLALVLLIFAGGIFNLFVRPLEKSSEDSHFLATKIHNIHSIERLKQVLMEVIMVMLAVLFLRGVLFMGDNVPWRALILPVGIALIALSLKLVEWGRPNQ